MDNDPMVRLTVLRLVPLQIVKGMGAMAMIAGVAVRRGWVDSTTTLGVLCAFVCGLIVFVPRAWSRHGLQPLKEASGSLHIGAIHVRSNDVRCWTLAGRRVRIHPLAGELVVTLRLHDDGERAVHVLTSVLGPPLPLERRGSPRMIAWALFATATGAVLVPIAISMNVAWLMGIALPLVIVGFACTAAFMSRTVQRRGASTNQ